MRTEVRTLDAPGGPMGAFVALPGSVGGAGGGGGRSPAVVVVQEAFGVNDHIRDVCRRLAGAGYVALAPELYHRAAPGLEVPYEDFASARPHLTALTNDGIESDLRAAFAHLRAQPDVDPARVGLVGFCVGGFAAFLGACRLDPAATVAFYGGGIVSERPGFGIRPLLGEADGIRGPLLALFGAEDQGIPLADVERLRVRLGALSPAHEVHVYPGAGHGFFCDLRPGSYHAASAADAWGRTLAWFGRHLAG